MGGRGGEGGRGGRGGVGGERTSGLFVRSFLPAFKEKTTQEHVFTSYRSACEVWVDSDILENFARNGTNAIVARSLSIVKYSSEEECSSRKRHANQSVSISCVSMYFCNRYAFICVHR